MPEIDIWRVVNLMLKRHGGEAEAESAMRTAELAPKSDGAGAAVWRVTDTTGQLVNTALRAGCAE